MSALPRERTCVMRFSQIVRWNLQMTFVLFSLAIAATFFISSLMLLNYGRILGLRYLKKEAGNMAGLTTVEGAVFALIGLLLAFTISGALQRFDERRLLVIQEANAARTVHDRLGLFEHDIARDLQAKLRAYVQARIDLYRMPHDFSCGNERNSFPPSSSTRFSTSKPRSGTRRSPPAQRLAFGPRVGRPFRRSPPYLTSRDCDLAPAKNTHLRLCM